MSQRTNIMLCYPFEEKRFNKWGDKAVIQPKLDGFRCRALIRPDRVELLSSTEGSFAVAVPHLVNLLYEFRKVFLNAGIFELDGELYNHDMSFEEINSICSRSVNIHPYHEQIQYHIFDHVCDKTLCITRLNEVSQPISWLDNEWIQMVPGLGVYSMDDVETALMDMTEAGYEGIIARHFEGPYERKRSTGIMKWKPRYRDAYKIVGLIEEHDIHGNPKDRLGAFLVRDDYGHEFKVGTGFTDKQRESYWAFPNMCVDRSCVIKYQHISDKGVPRFPVFGVMVE